MLDHKKIITVAIFGISVAAFLAVFYFGIFLPQKKIRAAESQKQEQKRQQDQKQEVVEKAKFVPDSESSKFEDFPASESFSGTPASPDFKTNPICDNEKEMKTFEKPIQVEWLAKFSGCLSGCEGASFVRLPENGNFKHPYFAGYVNGTIAEEFFKEDLTLKISGKWVGIDADHPKLVFDNKCVPIVNIEKIEVVK